MGISNKFDDPYVGDYDVDAIYISNISYIQDTFSTLFCLISMRVMKFLMLYMIKIDVCVYLEYIYIYVTNFEGL